MHGFGMWGSGIWMIVFWVAVVGLAIWFLRSLFSQQSQSDSQVRSPKEIAKARYASGEISRDEYQEILYNLKEKNNETAV
ncbi:MAG: SHOCT domain-containing protein [Anaerolineae bacterium]|nr:SHOCT domain-containing protein [Anaerolineae bacterium]